MFKLIENGITPKIKTEYSSSSDLCTRVDVAIKPGETKIIPLGVKIDLSYFERLQNEARLTFSEMKALSYPQSDIDNCIESYENFLKSHFFELKLRSSLAAKKGLIINNGVGEIDADYPDEIGLIVHNPLRLKPDSNEIDFENIIEFKAGDPVAQIKLMRHENDLSPKEYKTFEKRIGGFGSTNAQSK